MGKKVFQLIWTPHATAESSLPNKNCIASAALSPDQFLTRRRPQPWRISEVHLRYALSSQMSVCCRCFVSSGGGFFLACQDLGRMFDFSFPACSFHPFFSFLFSSFFFEVEISSRTPTSLFRPGSVHSGSASWDDCGSVLPEELRVNSFPITLPHYAWKAA